MQRNRKPIRAWQVVHGFLVFCTDCIGAIANAYLYVTDNPGSALPLGIGILVCGVFNVTGYYEMFIRFPELLIPGAENFRVNLASGTILFIVSFVISLCIQAMQAKAIRDNFFKNKKKFEEVSGLTVPDPNPKAIDIVESRRRRYKRSGMRQKNLGSLGIFASYGLDILSGFLQFPLGQGFSTSPMLGLGYLIMLCLHVVGVELCAAYFQDAWAEFKEEHGGSSPGKADPSTGMGGQGARPMQMPQPSAGKQGGKGQQQSKGKSESLEDIEAEIAAMTKLMGGGK